MCRDYRDLLGWREARFGAIVHLVLLHRTQMARLLCGRSVWARAWAGETVLFADSRVKVGGRMAARGDTYACKFLNGHGAQPGRVQRETAGCIWRERERRRRRPGKKRPKRGDHVRVGSRESARHLEDDDCALAMAAPHRVRLCLRDTPGHTAWPTLARTEAGAQQPGRARSAIAIAEPRGVTSWREGVTGQLSSESHVGRRPCRPAPACPARPRNP